MVERPIDRLHGQSCTRSIINCAPQDASLLGTHAAPMKRARAEPIKQLEPQEALQQAADEGLTLQPSSGSGRYAGVTFVERSKGNPFFKAQIWHEGKRKCLGSFQHAEHAALVYARESKGIGREHACPGTREQLSPQEALQQAANEGLTLQQSNGRGRFVGVYYDARRGNPYQAQIRHDGVLRGLGYYQHAEHAALVYARERKEIQEPAREQLSPQEALRRHDEGLSKLAACVFSSQPPPSAPTSGAGPP